MIANLWVKKQNANPVS